MKNINYFLLMCLGLTLKLQAMQEDDENLKKRKIEEIENLKDCSIAKKRKTTSAQNTPEENETLLHQAIKENNLDTIKSLLDLGVSTEIRDEEGNTPLMRAIAVEDDKDLKISRLLIERGANIEARDEEGETPLFFAIEAKNPIETIDLLLSKGANLEAKNNYGETALLTTFSGSIWIEDHLKILLHLAAKGANLLAKDNTETNIIHLAADFLDNSKDEEFQKLLDTFLQAGGNLLDLNQKKETILHIAASEGKANFIKIILEKNFPVNMQDENNETALHKALSQSRMNPEQYMKTIQLLIDNDADLTIQNIYNQTPLDLASQEVLDWIELTDKVA